ncbi:MAG TPA: S9 family peptidase [Acidobacteria bacterium]|nr:S9 family peptidase [Acidobacteriota bacterium]HAK53939.1 S9 family peptidase [Acidobacteriota bacterium]
MVGAVVVSLLLLGSSGCSSDPADRVLAYPESARSDHVDEYHGVEVADPYRWLEALDADETATWVEAQNELSRPYLAANASREGIVDRITELWNYERLDPPVKQGGRYFFERNDGLQNHDILYTATSLDADADDARVLIDPNTFRDDGTVSLGGTSIGPDGRYIAYGMSDGGSDWRTWKVRDVETGEDLDDELRFIKFNSPSWAPDGESFYYSRYPEGADGQGDGSATVAIYRHEIGAAQDDDILVYRVPGDTRQNPYATVTDDGRFLVVRISEGSLANAIAYRPFDQPDAALEPLLDEWDATYTLVGSRGDTLYFRTTNGAPRGRLIGVDVGQPDPASWTEVVAESDDTLQSVGHIGGHFVARYLHDAHARVAVHDEGGALVREVELPGIGSAGGFGGEPDDSETFYSFTGFTTPPTIYRYDVATGESSLFREPDVAIDLGAFETTQVFYASTDGTQIPMFVTAQKGIELDGSRPTLLYGYGGFNISLTPGFNVARLVWLEMGGVLAIPNLRGGGEYGEAWHLAGTKLQKQNVFDDFIAAAEWLIAEGYTSTPRLAIQGGSNGGLLVGAVMTQRPDLFGAALPAVGVMDMLRYHTPSANARNWSTDYGLSENADEFEAQLAYSPYHNLTEGVCYPPTLVTTADHDDRVVPWHSFKFGAALQHAQGCANPVLVRVETRAGHGAGTPTWMRIEALADQWTFLASALGL